MSTARDSSLTCTALLATLLAPALGGCGLGPRSPEAVEQVTLAIAVVPAEVSCVRITAAGAGRTLVRELEATGGMPLTKALSGVPLGTVTFTGEAFPAACDAVSKSTIPTWVSEPLEVSIVLGRSTTVDLTMVRNGRAKVEVGFSEEPACSAAGTSCLASAECCSRKCLAHVCTAGDGGAGDALTEESDASEP